MSEDIFRGHGVEIRLKNPEDFLKIKETLTRIGIASIKDNTLYQSCHILHKQGRYAILHFKELFSLDGKSTNITSEDMQRRDLIVHLLREYGLLETVNPDFKKTEAKMTVKIIPFKEKSKWNLVPKYTVGKKSGHKES